ncbi:hypothetical protein ACJJTC_001163 [Scirpophaga incertulas]
MASTQDAWYISLLGLAEHFRTSNPPDIKSCIQCLQAVFNFKPPQRVEARTHLQLGNILLTHTKNIDLARTHLEQSWCLSQTINGFDDVKFEAASVLAELFEQQGQPTHSKPILRKAIELSQHSVYWHCRLIFQLAQIHATEREYEVASSLLGVGVDYAQISNAAYTRVLFLLSRVMLLLIDKKIQEVLPLLNQAGHLVDSWTGSPHQKEYLKVFFLVLQVCHYLMRGQVKTVKPYLKQLQQSIQTIMAPTWPDDDAVCGSAPGESFVWLSRQQLYVLVYLVTVMHSAQAGYMDKAHKYTEKALSQIEKLTSNGVGDGGVRSSAALAWRLRLALVEHAALCRLVAGGKAHALYEIARAAHLLNTAPEREYSVQCTCGCGCGCGCGWRWWSTPRCAGSWRAARRTRCTRSRAPRTCSTPRPSVSTQCSARAAAAAAAAGAGGARRAVPARGGRQGARAVRDRARRAPAQHRARAAVHVRLRLRLRLALVEHAALCRLVAGGKAHALYEIARAAHLLNTAPEREYSVQCTCGCGCGWRWWSTPRCAGSWRAARRTRCTRSRAPRTCSTPRPSHAALCRLVAGGKAHALYEIARAAHLLNTAPEREYSVQCTCGCGCGWRWWSTPRCAGSWRAARRTRCTRSRAPRTCSTPRPSHAALCRLVAGGKAHALYEIARAAHLLNTAPEREYSVQCTCGCGCGWRWWSTPRCAGSWRAARRTRCTRSRAPRTCSTPRPSVSTQCSARAAAAAAAAGAGGARRAVPARGGRQGARAVRDRARRAPAQHRARAAVHVRLRLRLALVEHAALCRLVAGGKAHALYEIARAAHLLNTAPEPCSAATHTPQLHCLLGLYAMSMNCMEAAESQFLTAIHMSQERDLWMFAKF